MNRLLAVAVLVVVPAVVSAQQHPAPAYRREVPPRLLRQAKVTEDSALKVATARIPNGAVQALELENEHGLLIWSFEFKLPGRPGIYEVNVNAKNGSLVGKVEHEGPTGR
jgi:uncharacterized membrane protein YkoI